MIAYLFLSDRLLSGGRLLAHISLCVCRSTIAINCSKISILLNVNMFANNVYSLSLSPFCLANWQFPPMNTLIRHTINPFENTGCQTCLRSGDRQEHRKSDRHAVVRGSYAKARQSKRSIEAHSTRRPKGDQGWQG